MPSVTKCHELRKLSRRVVDAIRDVHRAKKESLDALARAIEKERVAVDALREHVKQHGCHSEG
jgi:hypothetical protein